MWHSTLLDDQSVTKLRNLLMRRPPSNRCFFREICTSRPQRANVVSKMVLLFIFMCTVIHWKTIEMAVSRLFSVFGSCSWIPTAMVKHDGAVWFRILVDYLVNLVTFFFCVKWRRVCVCTTVAMQLVLLAPLAFHTDFGCDACRTTENFTVARFYLSIGFMCVSSWNFIFTFSTMQHSFTSLFFLFSFCLSHSLRSILLSALFLCVYFQFSSCGFALFFGVSECVATFKTGK